MLRPPLIYLITSRLAFRRKTERLPDDLKKNLPDVPAEWHAQLAAIRLAAEAGCQLIQIREQDLSTRALCTFVRAAISLARPCGARVLVNDRVDVALVTGADGVHLRTTSIPIAEVRRISQSKRTSSFLIGVSTHTLAEARAADSAGADFIVFGPVFPPLSKKVEGELPGLSGLTEICGSVHIPVLGLGGIEMNNADKVFDCGAVGIAAITLFTDFDCLRGNIEKLLRLKVASQN